MTTKKKAKKPTVKKNLTVHPAVKCDHCNLLGGERYRQNTQYVEEDRNWVTLCPKCRKENDEYWSQMWSDYYSDVF